MVGNLVYGDVLHCKTKYLTIYPRFTIKINFRPYIRQYTSPNENFEYSYPLNIFGDMNAETSLEVYYSAIMKFTKYENCTILHRFYILYP